jgi:PAS domain S-box-containing protein
MTTEQEVEVGRCIFREANDAFFLIHPVDQCVLDANPTAQRLTGLRRRHLLGLPLYELMEADPPHELAELASACQTTGYFAPTDGFYLKTAGGGRRAVQISVSRVHAEPEPLGLAVLRDVTRQKRSEEALRESEARLRLALGATQKSLGVLAGGIAHDFNNLLTAILANAGLALTDLPPGSAVRPLVEQIEQAALRAADLTRQMLAYSGRGRFVLQPVSLSRVVEEMAGLLQNVISRKASLRFDVAPDLPAVEADLTQVRQVALNLIANASEALGDGAGIIAVRTGVVQADRAYLATAHTREDLPEGPYAYLEVADTGCGMDEATLARAFDPFFTTKFIGRGLGLAAVLGIVQGHGGAIHVASAPGQGSTFRVLFPCGPAAVLK